MKTKLVYVVVSTEKDIYLEQAYISMYSAKYYMPDVHISLLTDNHTKSTFIGTRFEELKYVDELICVNLDAKYNGQQRSRILKTSVRQHIKGDFLFIDSDTIITKPLDDIDNCSYDIAACRDSHSTFKENPYREMCINHGKLLEWPIETEKKYYNSGIIYVKDNNRSHEFYDLWSKNWLEGLTKGVSMDQPAFAKTNYMLKHPIKELDDIWNCELKHGIKFLKDAKIVHYLTTNKSTNKSKQFFIMNDLETFKDVKAFAVIDEKIQRTVQDPFYGIANVTHCFAGDDIYFFRTTSFHLIRRLYNKELVFNTVEKLFKLLNKIYSIIKR